MSAPRRDEPDRVCEARQRELIDLALDGVMTTDERGEFDRALARDAGLRERFDAESRMVRALSEPVLGRDRTHAILANVQRRREFLNAPSRASVWASRGAIAASIALGLTAIALIERSKPRSMPWSREASPLAAVDQASRFDAASTANSLSEAVSAVKRATAGPLGGSKNGSPVGPGIPSDALGRLEKRFTYRIAMTPPSGAGRPDFRLMNDESGGGTVVVVSTVERRALRSDWDAGLASAPGAPLSVGDDDARSWWVRSFVRGELPPGRVEGGK